MEFTSSDERLVLCDLEALFPSILMKGVLFYLEECLLKWNLTSLAWKWGTGIWWRDIHDRKLFTWTPERFKKWKKFIVNTDVIAGLISKKQNTKKCGLWPTSLTIRNWGEEELSSFVKTQKNNERLENRYGVI